MQGKFVSISGGEGGGKTTQLKLLRERLPLLYPSHEFVFTREPGGSPVAEKIRELILSDELKDASGKLMFGLFTTARYDHIEHTILPALQSGKTVICDRFLQETFAYQVRAMPNPAGMADFLEHQHRIPFDLPLQIIIDIDPELARERMKGRMERMTHFDARGPEFHRKLREAFAYWVHTHRQEAVLVDGSRSVEEVHAEIVDLIRTRILA